MRTLGKIAATLGVIGAIAVGSVVPAARLLSSLPPSLVERLLTPNFEAASTGGFLFCGDGVATLDYIVFAVLSAGLVVAVVITVRSHK
jgi:hypothetical protein